MRTVWGFRASELSRVSDLLVPSGLLPSGRQKLLTKEWFLNFHVAP